MLEEKIRQDYIRAMKEKDALRSSTLSLLRAQLKNVSIEKRNEKLEDQDILAVIKKQVKQREDAIEQFEKGGRNDLADKEKAERDVLKGYLPPALSREELSALVEKAVEETEACSLKDMGKVMKKVLDEAAGRADNRTVSDLVRKRLG